MPQDMRRQERGRKGGDMIAFDRGRLYGRALKDNAVAHP